MLSLSSRYCSGPHELPRATACRLSLFIRFRNCKIRGGAEAKAIPFCQGDEFGRKRKRRKCDKRCVVEIPDEGLGILAAASVEDIPDEKTTFSCSGLLDPLEISTRRASVHKRRTKATDRPESRETGSRHFLHTPPELAPGDIGTPALAKGSIPLGGDVTEVELQLCDPGNAAGIQTCCRMQPMLGSGAKLLLDQERSRPNVGCIHAALNFTCSQSASESLP